MKGYGKIVVVFGVLISNIVTKSEGNVISKRENQSRSTSMLVEMAKQLMGNTGDPTQVLNINLSNVFLLLLLKAVVFTAGYMGNHEPKSRKLDEDNIFSEDETALALGYLMGDTCLYRAACEAPNTAKEYLAAVDIITQASELLSQSLPFDHKYGEKISELRKAIEYGDTKQCPPEYNCKKENINSFLRPE